MMRSAKLWVAGLLSALGASTWATVSYYRQQTRLYVQLEQLTSVLTSENDEAVHQANNALNGMQAAVVKNRNLPSDVAVLRRAEEVRGCVRRLLGALHDYGDTLRHTTANSATYSPLPHPGAPGQLPQQRQALMQQVAACADTLRKATSGGLPPLPALALTDTTPVVETLADLAQLESAVLTQQTLTLKQLSHRVGYKRLAANHLLAAASAESNVVAPGDTYRAELFLVAHFGNDLRMQMACNGQPVAVGQDGVGLVRFRAPLKPGSATWTGTVRFNENGRDTTYQVRVPYRVARR